MRNGFVDHVAFAEIQYVMKKGGSKIMNHPRKEVRMKHYKALILRWFTII
jgi:hypothetical protein